MSLNYLKSKHKNPLLELLQKYEEMFDRTFGNYIGYDYTIELKEDAKLYHAKTFTKLNIHKPTLKREVDRLIKIKVLQKNSQQDTPKINVWYHKIYL